MELEDFAKNWLDIAPFISRKRWDLYSNEDKFNVFTSLEYIATAIHEYTGSPITKGEFLEYDANTQWCVVCFLDRYIEGRCNRTGSDVEFPSFKETRYISFEGREN